MKYTILINQLGAHNAGLSVLLDIVDLAVFDSFKDFANGPHCEKLIEGKRVWFWISYDKIIEQLPMVPIKTKDAVYRRMKNLEQAKIIRFHPKSKQMGKAFFCWGDNYAALLSSNEAAAPIGLKSEPPSDNYPNPIGLKSEPPSDNYPMYNTINKDKTIIDKTIIDNNIPAAKKTAGNQPPNEPEDQPKKIPWTKTIAALFDQVNEEESAALGVEFTNFNWGAGAARQFKALKDTRKAMIPDIRAKLKHEPTEQEIESGFDYLFRYGFRYLAGIAESRGGTFQFTPAIILNNYNNILQYAKQNHNPTSKQDRANAKRDAAYEELFRMGLAMDV